MKKRIYGLESEYGIIYTSNGIKTLPVEKVVRYLFEKLITTESFLNVFLENGSRIYLDTGCHPEYATPEVTNLRDLLRFDKAGEKLMQDLLHHAEGRLRSAGMTGNLSIFKNNTDFSGNSYGCHENYLVERTSDFYHIAEQLIPFLVTRQVFAGAGKVVQTRWGTDYFLSQRAEHICHTISGTTTNDRSIINTRDEPHADKEKYRRLHVIVGDSNMSEYTNYLRVGTTALVLEMIEHGFIKQDFATRNPVKALRDISHDFTCKKKIKLDDGRKLSAVELQKEYMELAMKFYAMQPPDPVSEDILAKWEHVLSCLDEEPMQLNRQIDWVIKKQLIESYRTKKNIPWNSHRILMLDLQYHDIREEKSLYYMLERKGLVERMLNDEEIAQAMVDPPTDTRAKLRGDFIKLAKRLNIRYDLDWSYIRLGSLLNIRMICKNPFQNNIDKLTELQRKFEKSPSRRFFTL
jgi:proteasome accessory factor A